MSAYTNHTNVTKYERFFWRVAMLIVIGDLLISLGFLFGLPTNSPSYDVAKSLISLHAWGFVALLAAVLYFVGMMRHNRWLMLSGLTIGGFYTTLFAITFIFAYLFGTLAGFTSVVWWLVIGAMHTIAAIALPTTAQIKRLKNDTITFSR